MDNNGRTCCECGSTFLIKTNYEAVSESVGKVKVFDVTYAYCPKCKIELIPNNILVKWEEMEKHLILNALAKRLNIIEDINKQYMTSHDLAELLNISHKRLVGKSLDMHVLHNKIFYITLFGNRYYLRESVAKFITCGDGRFKLN